MAFLSGEVYKGQISMNETLGAHKILTTVAVVSAVALVFSMAAPDQTVAAVAEKIGLQDRPVEVRVVEPTAKDPEVRPAAARKPVGTGSQTDSGDQKPAPTT